MKSLDEIQEEYGEYLTQHTSNVQKGFEWLSKNIPEIIPDNLSGIIAENIFYHDYSKYGEEEYIPYANYFYDERTPEVEASFNYAWLHHIHHNPHHWQYWVLVHDDEPAECLEMPYEYIVEMICDWWAFSWKTGKLDEIFKWYDEHKSGIQLHENSRKTLENILNKLKEKLRGEK